MALRKKYLPIYDMWVTLEDSDVEVPNEECEKECEKNNEVNEEEKQEVIENIQEQVDDNAEVLENNPDSVTEEMATEANNFFIMALGQLGYGSRELKNISLGQESRNTPIENLRITQKSMREFLKSNKK